MRLLSSTLGGPHVDELRFDGRVVVVTGGGRGVGRAHVLLLGARGAQVVVADYGASLAGAGSSSAPADDVVQEIRAAGGEAVACFASVAEEPGAASIVDAALTNFGRIDAVINNAGISDKHPFDELTVEQYRRMMDVHMFGTLFVTRAAWPHFVNGRLRAGRQHDLRRDAGHARAAHELRLRQGRGPRPDEDARRGGRRARHPRQRGRAAGPDPDGRRRQGRLRAGERGRPPVRRGDGEPRPRAGLPDRGVPRARVLPAQRRSAGLGWRQRPADGGRAVARHQQARAHGRGRRREPRHDPRHHRPRGSRHRRVRELRVPSLTSHPSCKGGPR